MRVSLLMAEAIAQPTAWMYWVARLPEIEKKPCSFDEYMTGSWRPLQRVGLIGEDLVHHGDHRIAAGDQQAGLPVGREIHVAGRQRLAEGGAHRLFAEMLHVEGRLALALRHLHARVEGSERHHVAQAFEQVLVRQQPGPSADRLALAVQARG